jgi:riboflavin synthase
MFTGIVEETGCLVAFAPGLRAWSLQLAASTVLPGLAVGDSVAVNGCCLTVTRFDAQHLWFDVLEETRRLTSLGDLLPGDAVNLERSLRADARLGGHFVTGHIDATGDVVVFEPRGADHFLSVTAPRDLLRYVAWKGSIAINGVSLTVAEVRADGFAVWLIPHTLKVTNLGALVAGRRVNLEFDLLAKYLEHLNARPSA